VARRPTKRELELEIVRLRGLELTDLRKIWEDHYGLPVPKTLRREMLVRSILWQIQAKAFGGLNPATRKYLVKVADAARSPAAKTPAPPLRIRAGTRLIRDWQNRTHTVTALEEGFEWQGKRYRSLSQIARSITGTRWNGPVFFGVKRKPTPQQKARRTDHVNDPERPNA